MSACCLECVAYVLLLHGFKRAFPAFKHIGKSKGLNILSALSFSRK